MILVHKRSPAGKLSEWLTVAVLVVDARLTQRRVRGYATLFLASVVLAYAALVALGRLPFDALGKPVAVDYANHVVGGRIALEGQMPRLYDLAYQWKTQQAILGPGQEDHLSLFLLPPFVAYLYAPFAALPYLLGAAVWTAVSLGLLVLSLRLLWPLVPNLHRHGFGTILLVALSSVPAIENLAGGQDAALSIFLYTASLRLLLVRRDAAAGAVLGLGIFKPQIFMIAPLLLLWQRRWYALAAWLAVAGALAALSVALVGPDGVKGYAGLLASDFYAQKVVEEMGWKMQSVPALVRALLPPPAAALVTTPVAIGVGVALLALLGGRKLWRAGAASAAAPDQTLLYAIALLAVPVVSPHFFLYDLTILLLPALILADRASVPSTRILLASLYLLTWTTPVRHAVFGQESFGQGPLGVLDAPWAALIAIALFIAAQRLLDRPDIVHGATVAQERFTCSPLWLNKNSMVLHEDER